jgi:FMN phosphatase YigB (HAD superfamily)
LEAVVYSAQVGVEKPHPAIFDELLSNLQLPAGAVLHVGDSRRDDVEGALAVGLQALWLTRDSRRGDLCSLDDLPPRLGVGSGLPGC